MRYAKSFLAFAAALVVAGSAPAFHAAGAHASPCPFDQKIPVWFEIRPPYPCAGDEVRLIIRGCQGCPDLISAEKPPSGPVQVHARGPEICPLTLVCWPESLEVLLGTFQAGNALLAVDVIEDIVRGDSVVCTLVNHDSVAFVVDECPPPPPPGQLPYVDAIRVGWPSVCPPSSPPVCPGEPYPVSVRGTFPDNCFHLRRIELLPSDITVIGPPIVRIIVDDGGCFARPCVLGEFPWAGVVMLPPLPSGSYLLPVVVARVTCSDSVRSTDSTYFATVPFTVAEDCSVSHAPCLVADWKHSANDGRCDAFVGPDHPAELGLEVQSLVPLAGLQGDLRLDPPGLLIKDLMPVGPASGMHLSWQRTPTGAQFLLFAESGAPIPALPPNFTRLAAPVLRVTVVRPEVTAASPDPVPSLTLLRAEHVLGADVVGRGVPECQPPACLRIPLLDRAARICTQGECDFNGDAHADIRDLVIMVHCILGTGICPDPSADFDCNQDGTQSLDDVLCCAGFILGGGIQDTTGSRHEPGIQVTYGEPMRTDAGVDLPVHLAGADRMGAARLALQFPRDRFDVASVDLVTGGGSGWLKLHEVRDAGLLIGLIGLGPASGIMAPPPTSGSPATNELQLMIHFALKPGQEPGGEVRLSESDFSGPDGVALTTDVGQPAIAISGPARIALSAGRPNPFSGETRFTLSLERASDVEVAVHDLGGRLVATLHPGRLEAGTHPLAWDGRLGDGSAAPNGLYFFQVRAGAGQASRKVILLRGK